MKRTITRIATIIMAIAMIATLLNPVTAQAANKKAKLNKTNVTLTITDKKKSPATTLKIKNVSKKVAKKAVWKSNNKKIVTINKNGKIVGKKKGKATITCKVNGKKLTCKIVVKDKRKFGDAPITNCNHNWKMWDDWKLVKVPMDNKCWKVVNGATTEFKICGYCGTPYKNNNVAFHNFLGTCPKNPDGEHTCGTFEFSNGSFPGTKDNTPKYYFIVADGRCTNCDAYHEPDECK